MGRAQRQEGAMVGGEEGEEGARATFPDTKLAEPRTHADETLNAQCGSPWLIVATVNGVDVVIHYCVNWDLLRVLDAPSTAM
jgi:hypothetical protein